MSQSVRQSMSRSRSILLGLSLLVVAVLALEMFPVRHVQAVSTSVVISEFRTRGPNGASDEFVELFNVTNSPIDIGGWKINGSNSGGTVSTRVTITTGTMIPAHGHFLATNSSTSGGPYSGSVPGNPEERVAAPKIPIIMVMISW